MKKQPMWFCLILVTAILSLNGIAQAVEISGKVVKADAIAKQLTIQQLDPQGNALGEKVFSVSDATTVKGAESFAEIIAGDQVKVDAVRDAETQSWKAASIEKVM